MRLYVAVGLGSAPNLERAAVTHSSKFLCVIKRRTRVRRIASDISQVWYARNVTVNRPGTHRAPDRRTRRENGFLFEIPFRRGYSPVKNGRRAGIATFARISPVHSQREADGSSQLTISVRKAAGANRVRRRLSRIFHRPIAGMTNGFGFPGREPHPKRKGRSCQSPRAQRC